MVPVEQDDEQCRLYDSQIHLSRQERAALLQTAARGDRPWPLLPQSNFLSHMWH